MPGWVLGSNQHQVGHPIALFMLLWSWQAQPVLEAASHPTQGAVGPNFEEGSTAGRGGATSLDTGVQGVDISDGCEVDEGGVASSNGDGRRENLTQKIGTRRWGREGERRLKRKRGSSYISGGHR